MKPATLVVSLLALAGLAALIYGVHDLLQIGTCASGGPYVSARPCPKGTGASILLVMAGSMVAIISMIAASFRSFSAGMFWFGLTFTALGALFLISQATGDINGGGGVGWVLGAVFIPMGLAPLYGGIRGLLEERREPPAAAPWTGPYVAGTVLQQASRPPQDRG
jgi:hypothetical protein